jgi:quercetin dioxygenase-like cupin family protein
MSAYVRGASEGETPEPFNIFGDQVLVKVPGSAAQGKYTVLTGETPPMGGPPLHRHLSDHETFYVLEGDFVFELDGVLVDAGPGSTVHIPPGVVHLYQNRGETPGRLLLVVEPAGLDEFFQELHDLLQAHAMPPMEELAGLHARHRMELLGPPLAARPEPSGS